MNNDDVVTVRFPALNKNETLEENDAYIETSCNMLACKIRKIVRVSPRVFDVLGDTLLDDNSIWEKIGGRSAGYTNVVLVTDGKREFFVNTEGFSYARYVGRRA